MSARKAVILLSGGLDSATVLAIARDQGFECHALSIDYGQRHEYELNSARAMAERMQVASHKVLPMDLRIFGGSALTADIEVPKGRDEEEMTSEIPATYVPARNLVFLSLALGFAEVLGARDIFIGVNAVDYSGYPDCRPEFVEAFERTANLATRAAVQGETVTIHAPLIEWTKAQIIKRGAELGVDYAVTHSCYDPGRDGGACGSCDSCNIRRAGFEAAGVPDPTRYA